VLHLISQSPIETAIFERIDSGDDVVFLENAVLHILLHSRINARLTQLLSANHICVLSNDIAVRGIAPDELIKGVEIIDYVGLVELTVNNRVIQSWS
jgi:tRNA 2-thiouridine synthesizing protein B